MDTTHPPIHKNPGGEPASLSLHLWAKLQSPFPFSFLTPLCSCCLTDLYLFQQQMSSIRPSHRSLLIVLIIHTDPIHLCFQKLAFLQASGWLQFFFFFFFFFLAVTLFPNSPSNFCMFLSVISKCLCWHKLLPTSGGKKKFKSPCTHPYARSLPIPLPQLVWQQKQYLLWRQRLPQPLQMLWLEQCGRI